jgi:transposase
MHAAFITTGGVMQNVAYVGLDVHKATISVTVAEDGRDGAVRFIGVIPNTPGDVLKLVRRLAKDDQRLEFCYEAGCCGYGIYRQIVELGHGCTVVAPTLIPRKSGDRIKTDRRDAAKLAVQHRSGDLTAVWVPDEIHEAMRDLVRARFDAVIHLVRARQQLLAFLLRRGRLYTIGKHWTLRHRRWLSHQEFTQPAHQIVFQDYVEAVTTAQERRDQLEKRTTATLPTWSLAPLVNAVRALRGLDLISATTLVAAIGDVSRFDTPQKLMAYLGLVPSEQSSGERVRRGGITKTGNKEARRMLIEAAWNYRFPARVAQDKSEILVRQPKPIRDIAWKAQVRLCGRYRRLVALGKKPHIAITSKNSTWRRSLQMGQGMYPLRLVRLPRYAFVGAGSADEALIGREPSGRAVFRQPQLRR